MVPSSHILVDAGQTGSRIRIVAGGRVVDHEVDPVHTDRPVVDQVAELIRSVVPKTQPGAQLAVGVSGLTPAATKPQQLLDLVGSVGVTRVVLTHDSVSSYLAANAFEFGAVCAVGTGVVTLGAGPSGTARVDGWGHLFGDAGSAYWIGRAGIDAALRAYDGRGGDTTLMVAATEHFGSLPELYMQLQGDPDRVSRTAGFARSVAESADGGDHIAGAIIDSAAVELADSAVAALGRCGALGSASPTTEESGARQSRVSWTGTVPAANRRLRERFVTEVTTRAPQVAVREPLGDTMSGLERLLAVPVGHPLTELVADAGSLTDAGT
ncbi:N-acetylglucosamine kinase [Gordonia soli]|uniref:N-acetylglucosamine kinase n=1 Tax=Gordonia soli TaxID=320799 RepID=UPI00034AB3CD|nr:BadF/BadG/BcrA/BcrD ATPase family protein [Gordonia soli]